MLTSWAPCSRRVTSCTRAAPRWWCCATNASSLSARCRTIYSAWMQVYLGEFLEEEKDKVLKRLGLDEVTEKVHDFALSATTAIGELMDKPRIARIEQHKNKVTKRIEQQKDAVRKKENEAKEMARRQKQQQANAWSARATR